jgi:cation diffusion facilitator family transporter
MDPRKRLVIVSLGATISILSIRLVVYLLTKSLAVLADAFHGLTDLVGNIIALLALTVSLRGPDKEHLYGHEKAESIGSLMISFLLIGVFIYIVYESIQRVFFAETSPEFSVLTSALILLTIFVDLWRSRALEKGASIYGSTVLYADALHYRSDLFVTSSVFTLSIIGQLGIRREVVNLMDIGISILISSYFINASYKLAKVSIDELMDKAPSEVIDLFNKLAKEHDLEIRSIRARRSGPRIFLDAIVVMPPRLSLEEAHSIVEKIEEDLRKKIKRNIDIVIHMEPREEIAEIIKKNIEKYLSSVQEIRGYHDINIVKGEKGYHVRLHVEVSPDTKVDEINNLISNLEYQIKKNFSDIETVMIHVEPICLEEINVREAINNFIESDPLARKIIKISSIRIIDTRDKLLVDIVVETSAKTNIKAVHEVISRLEGYLSEILRSKAVVTVSIKVSQS